MDSSCPLSVCLLPLGSLIVSGDKWMVHETTSWILVFYTHSVLFRLPLCDGIFVYVEVLQKIEGIQIVIASWMGSASNTNVETK